MTASVLRPVFCSSAQLFSFYNTYRQKDFWESRIHSILKKYSILKKLFQYFQIYTPTPHFNKKLVKSFFFLHVCVSKVEKKNHYTIFEFFENICLSDNLF